MLLLLLILGIDAARATEESATYFLFDSQVTSGSSVSPMLALGIAVVTLPFVALAIIIVVLYKMRQSSLDY